MKKCLSCDRPFSSDHWTCPNCGNQPRMKSGFISFAPESAQENEGFPADGFDRLALLEEKNFWFRSRNQILLWAFRKYFPDARHFFEVGCGNGFVLWAFAENFSNVGLGGSEIYEKGLFYTRQRVKEAALYQMDAKSLPFESEFDVIGAFDVLEHISEDEQVLAQMYKAAAPGGGILLTVPQHPFLWSYGDEFARHVRRYSAKELKRKVRGAGFKVVDSVSFVSLLLPLLFLSRLGLKKETYDPEGEFRISRTLNFILEKILSLERGLIRLGLRPPLGGSLLLIARKA
jgi:SAM-dependent methyltransferase